MDTLEAISTRCAQRRVVMGDDNLPEAHYERLLEAEEADMHAMAALQAVSVAGLKAKEGVLRGAEVVVLDNFGSKDEAMTALLFSVLEDIRRMSCSAASLGVAA